MSDYTSIELTVDQDPSGAIQLAISAVDNDGCGHGHRLAGPKYLGQSKPILTHPLSDEDVREIRSYLDIHDQIQAAGGTELGGRTA